MQAVEVLPIPPVPSMASFVCSFRTMREAKSETMSSRPKNISGATGCDGGIASGGLHMIVVSDFIFFTEIITFRSCRRFVVTLQRNVSYGTRMQDNASPYCVAVVHQGLDANISHPFAERLMYRPKITSDTTHINIASSVVLTSNLLKP
jgi:hypothetical protein